MKQSPVIKEMKVKYHFPLTKLAKSRGKLASINQTLVFTNRNVSWLLLGGSWAIIFSKTRISNSTPSNVD